MKSVDRQVPQKQAEWVIGIGFQIFPFSESLFLAPARPFLAFFSSPVCTLLGKFWRSWFPYSLGFARRGEASLGARALSSTTDENLLSIQMHFIRSEDRRGE